MSTDKLREGNNVEVPDSRIVLSSSLSQSIRDEEAKSCIKHASSI